jgi:DNA-binding response OmpR family regulator
MAKILVIEDDKEILAVMGLILTQDGHFVESSVDSTILNNIQSIKPELIILDDWLGMEKGSDICLKLKSDPATASIPIVLFTAHINGKELAKRVNADAFISKPFDIDELTALVNKLV